MRCNCYLSIDEEVLNQTREYAKKESRETFDDEKVAERTLLYSELEFHIDNIEIDRDDDTMCACGELYLDGKEFGFISIEIPITLDLLGDMVSVAVKKMNKVKTLLESLK